MNGNRDPRYLAIQFDLGELRNIAEKMAVAEPAYRNGHFHDASHIIERLLLLNFHRELHSYIQEKIHCLKSDLKSVAGLDVSHNAPISDLQIAIGDIYRIDLAIEGLHSRFGKMFLFDDAEAVNGSG